jgi:branched-chain amino acid transport system ATP-binding protein
MSEGTMAILEARNISVNFGKLQAVAGLSFEVERGTIHGLIGPNGAGKTTVFNTMTGVFRPSEGSVILDGEDITALPSHVIAKKGLARSFQQTLVFMGETVLENMLTGFHLGFGTGVFSEFVGGKKAKKAHAECVDRSMEILKLMGLDRLRDEFAGNLPHGHQKALGVSMALASSPKVLLLDEPVTGMNPVETQEMADRILAIREHGPTVVLVEHSMRVVMSLCDRITVMNYGRRIAEGACDEVRCDERVIEAYLGREDDEHVA